MSAKQKIVHGCGLSNLNLGIYVCSFDVCRAPKPFPSINYGESAGLLRTNWEMSLIYSRKDDVWSISEIVDGERRVNRVSRS